MTNFPVYQGHTIRHDDNGLICLSEMQRAVNGNRSNSPYEWSRFAGTDSLNTGKSRIYKTKRGNHGGGTWAHWQIALAYAKNLSHEFHAWCNTIIRQHLLVSAPPGADLQPLILAELRKLNDKADRLDLEVRHLHLVTSTPRPKPPPPEQQQVHIELVGANPSITYPNRNGPCEHGRRGHWRRLPGGRQTWVRPCRVGRAS